MNLFKRLKAKVIKVPATNELKEIEAVQVWVVKWESRYGNFSCDVTKEFEAFTNEDVANEFAESLRNAFSLIRHTSGTKVNVNPQKPQ